MLKKFVYWGFGVSIVFLSAFIFYQGLHYFMGPVQKSDVVMTMGQGGNLTPSTVIRQENKYLCDDIQLSYQGPIKDILPRVSKKDLEEKYPESNGWELQYTSDGMLVARHTVNDFCSLHKAYRHLGIHDNVLAVYEGPLGFEDHLLWLEEGKEIQRLPEDLRNCLQDAQHYKGLTETEQHVCQEQLEFANETLLNNVLENLDEMY